MFAKLLNLFLLDRYQLHLRDVCGENLPFLSCPIELSLHSHWERTPWKLRITSYKQIGKLVNWESSSTSQNQIGKQGNKIGNYHLHLIQTNWELGIGNHYLHRIQSKCLIGNWDGNHHPPHTIGIIIKLGNGESHFTSNNQIGKKDNPTHTHAYIHTIRLA